MMMEQENLSLSFDNAYSRNAMSFEEIGKRLGVSKERARQIFKNAIRKLRHPMFKKEAMELLEILAEIEKARIQEKVNTKMMKVANDEK